jgi:hypothetical protein
MTRESIKISTVDAEEGGRLFVSGRAPPNASVRLYLNDAMIAPATADGDGRVSFAIGRGVRAGSYRIRLDEIDRRSGNVSNTRGGDLYHVGSARSFAGPGPAPGQWHRSASVAVS